MFLGCAILFRFRTPPHVRRDGVAATERDASAPEPNPDRARDDATRRTAQTRIGDRKPTNHAVLQHGKGHAHGAAVYRLQSCRSDIAIFVGVVVFDVVNDDDVLVLVLDAVDCDFDAIVPFINATVYLIGI